MKELRINSMGSNGKDSRDQHFTGLDPDSVEILARVVSVPDERKLSLIDNAIAGINEALIETSGIGEWFNQQVKLMAELQRTRSKLEKK